MRYDGLRCFSYSNVYYLCTVPPRSLSFGSGFLVVVRVLVGLLGAWVRVSGFVCLALCYRWCCLASWLCGELGGWWLPSRCGSAECCDRPGQRTGRTGQDRRQDGTGQRTVQGTRQDRTGLATTGHDRTGHDRTADRAGQDRTGQASGQDMAGDMKGQDRTRDRTGDRKVDRTEDRTEGHDRTGDRPDRTEDMTGHDRTVHGTRNKTGPWPLIPNKQQ